MRGGMLLLRRRAVAFDRHRSLGDAPIGEFVKRPFSRAALREADAARMLEEQAQIIVPRDDAHALRLGHSPCEQLFSLVDHLEAQFLRFVAFVGHVPSPSLMA